MKFLEHLLENGIGLLETADGCNQKSLEAFLRLLSHFGYEGLAVAVRFNSKCENFRMKCPVGTLKKLFGEYL